MVHGQPDWSPLPPKATTFTLEDLAEHAVRVGSPVTHDRRGDVVWYTDFRHGLGDVESEGESGYELRLVAGGPARQGSFAACLYFPSGSIGYGTILKYLPYPVLGRVGLEATFSAEAFHADWELELQLRTGAVVIQPRIRYDVVNESLGYRPSAGADVLFATGLNLQALDTSHLTLKMVADLGAREYVRCIFNEHEYSLADIDCLTQTISLTRSFRAMVSSRNVNDLEMFGYVDNVIITQNEPL